MSSLSDLNKKVKQWNEQTEWYFEKVKKELEGHPQMSVPSSSGLLAYFTYSFNMTYRNGEDNLVVGNLHIKNQSQDTIDNLSICLLMKTDNLYHFTGKYMTTNDASRPKSNPVIWEKIDVEDQNAHWFKLADGIKIAPFETVTFSDFSVAWETDQNFLYRMDGFVYTDEEQEGIQAVNAINVFVEE